MVIYCIAKLVVSGMIIGGMVILLLKLLSIHIASNLSFELGDDEEMVKPNTIFFHEGELII